MRFLECFTYDFNLNNPYISGIFKKYIRYKNNFRYSMYVNLRLTEYFWFKYNVSKFYIFKFLADYFRNKNVRDNSFEHGYYHNIKKNVTFHHTDITFPNGTTILEGSHLYKGITLAKYDGKLPFIGRYNVIFSHSIIVGSKLNDNVVVGAGSVVVDDIAKNSLVVGSPGQRIKEIDDSYKFIEK